MPKLSIKLCEESDKIALCKDVHGGTDDRIALCLIEPENDCNDCDPRIPDTLYVTLSNLGGDFAQYNGTHELNWVGGCHWVIEFTPEERLILDWSDAAEAWDIVLNAAEVYCYKRWRHEGDPCDPDVGVYNEVECEDSFCSDTDSCDKSEGASANVSYTE